MARPLPLRTLRPLLQQRTPPKPYKNFVRFESNVRIQRVRIRQRIFSPRRLITYALYSTGAYVTLSWLFSPIDLDEEEEDASQLSEAHKHKVKKAMSKGTALEDVQSKESQDQAADDGDGVGEDTEGAEDGEEDENEDYYDEDALFIPLTWATPMPRTFYKGSDPEWQEFVKFSKDQNKHKKIRQDLVSMIKQAISNTAIGKRIGQIDHKKGRAWLDFVFPDGPPLEYERYGIEIADEYIALTSRPVSQQNYNRLERILFPTAAFSAMWAGATAITRESWVRLKAAFGVETNNTKPGNIFDQLAKQSAALDATRAENAPGNAAVSPLPGASPAGVANGGSANQKSAGIITMDLGQTKSSTMQSFAQAFARKWKPLPMEPPRGTIYVTGLVDIHGSRAKVTIDVGACYDPKLNKFVVIRLGLRRLTDNRQRPRGGN